MVRARRLFLVSLLVVFGGCLSPTLPLPPPATPEVETVSQGLVELSGTVPEPHATVIAENRMTGLFAGTTADEVGAYRFRIEAEPGQRLRLYYEAGSLRSEDLLFAVPEVGLPALAAPTLGGPDSEGWLTLSGQLPRPLGQLYVRHVERDETSSVASDSDGAYSLRLLAASGDALELWYVYGPDRSEPLAITVP